MIDDDSLETILVLIKQLEATLLGLKQTAGHVVKGGGQETLELLIEECQTKLTGIIRKVIQ